MSQMKRVKKMKSTKVDKHQRPGLRLRTKIKRTTYHVLIVTEKGEELTYRITRRRGRYKILEKRGAFYTHVKITSNLRVNSRITLYSQEGVVNGTIKKITALNPSTDVEPGDTPPIKMPGGH